MNSKKTVIILGTLLCFFITSCDPVNLILISNETPHTVTIIAETTHNFDTPYDPDNVEYSGSLDKPKVKFKIAPGKSVQCGSIVGSLKNKMPFTKIKIYTKNDSLIANNNEEIINLFDKNWLGKLKNPYNLKIN